MAIGKIVTRAVGGIVGKGSKNVNPVYRNTESAGKQKVERRVQKLNDIADARTGGEIGYVYKNKTKVVEYMTGKKVKGTTRDVIQNAQRTELEAKGYSKRESLPKYFTNKMNRELKKNNKPTPKVPVKRSKSK